MEMIHGESSDRCSDGDGGGGGGTALVEMSSRSGLGMDRLRGRVMAARFGWDWGRWLSTVSLNLRVMRYQRSNSLKMATIVLAA